MARPERHAEWPHEFELATMEAHGAIAGWCMGKGENPPMLTPVLKQAYEHAFAVVYDRAYADALRHIQRHLRRQVARRG